MYILWEFDGFIEEADYSDQLLSFYYIIVLTYLQNFLLDHTQIMGFFTIRVLLLHEIQLQ